METDLDQLTEAHVKKLLKPALVDLCLRLRLLLVDERKNAAERLRDRDEETERLLDVIQDYQDKLLSAGERAHEAEQQTLALRAAMDSANVRLHKYQLLLAEKDQRRHVEEVEARLRGGLNHAETVLADIGRTASRLSHDLRVLRRGAGRPGMSGGVEDVEGKEGGDGEQ